MLDDDRIDLNKLTYKEMLVKLYYKLESVDNSVEQLIRKQQKLEIKVKENEVKAKIYAAVVAGIVSALLIIVTKLIVL